MAMFMIILGVIGVFTGLVGFLGLVYGWVDRERTGIWLIVVGSALSLGALAAFGIGTPYWAGQGDAPQFASEWVKKWHPSAEANAQVECQPRDTDDNGYITCTVGYIDEAGTHKIEAIECGVNRWYQGWKVTGCRLMKGYSGSQP